jgi:hypothetical protein
MKFLCKECHSIVNPAETKADIKLGEKFIWIVAILGIIVGLFNKLVLVLAFLWLGVSITISLLLRNNKFLTCPRCNKHSLILVDTPEAQEIIKNHNLVIPEEPVEPPKPKAPWQVG